MTPVAVRAIVKARGAPAFECFCLGAGGWGLGARGLGLGAGCFLQIEQRAAGASNGQLANRRPGAARPAPRSPRHRPRASRRGRRPSRAGARGGARKSTLKRKRSSCARVDAAIAAAGVSTVNSRVRKRLTCGAIAIQQIRQRHWRPRRVRSETIGIPLAPERGVGGLHFLAEPFVQRRQAVGLVRSAKVYPGTPRAVVATGIGSISDGTTSLRRASARRHRFGRSTDRRS